MCMLARYCFSSIRYFEDVYTNQPDAEKVRLSFEHFMYVCTPLFKSNGNLIAMSKMVFSFNA